MAVMFLDHSCVRVPQLRRDDCQRGALHDEPRCISMTKAVKADVQQLCDIARREERALLLGSAPLSPVSSKEDILCAPSG